MMSLFRFHSLSNKQVVSLVQLIDEGEKCWKVDIEMENRWDISCVSSKLIVKGRVRITTEVRNNRCTCGREMEKSVDADLHRSASETGGDPLSARHAKKISMVENACKQSTAKQIRR